MFNHICTELFTGCLSLVGHVRHFCLAMDAIEKRIVPSATISQTLVNILAPTKGSRTNMVYGMLRESKNSKEKELNEKSLLWSLKLCRIVSDTKDGQEDQDD